MCVCGGEKCIVEYSVCEKIRFHVCRKRGSRLAQTGCEATPGLAASSGERVPILPHTAARHGGLNTSTL